MGILSYSSYSLSYYYPVYSSSTILHEFPLNSSNDSVFAGYLSIWNYRVFLLFSRRAVLWFRCSWKWILWDCLWIICLYGLLVVFVGSSIHPGLNLRWSSTIVLYKVCQYSSYTQFWKQKPCTSQSHSAISFNLETSSLSLILLLRYSQHSWFISSIPPS